jgi:hypothetical protein
MRVEGGGLLRRVMRHSGRGDLWSGGEPMVLRWRFDTQGQEDGGGGVWQGQGRLLRFARKGAGLAAGDGAPGIAVMKKGLLQNAVLSLLGMEAGVGDVAIGRSKAPACLIPCQFQ